MPVVYVICVICRALPSTAKISIKAKETIQKCIAEFIGFILNEANDIRKVDYRMVTIADDLVEAMYKLGFDHYVEPLRTLIRRYREVKGKDNTQAQQMRLYKPILLELAVIVSPLAVKSTTTTPMKEMNYNGGSSSNNDNGVDQYVDHGYGNVINGTTMMNFNGGSSSNNNRSSSNSIGGGRVEYVNHGCGVGVIGGGVIDNTTVINYDIV
uniref:Transcription factor CBF/NF-Y/archaeal histone domain-containing protein n=1 Tax=Chenopodium quinoa TaxID=63459 RepID=A0A803MT33_CHEQI